MNAFALLDERTTLAYEELAEAGEQLRIARLVVAELSHPDRRVDASVLALAVAELRRADREYFSRREALNL